MTIVEPKPFLRLHCRLTRIAFVGDLGAYTKRVVLSVGVILFNNVHNVDKLMKSLLDQKDTSFALIVIDNNSSDSSFASASAFSKKFEERGVSFKAFRGSRNLGELGALDLVSKICETEFITVVHGDDYLLEDFISNYNKILLRNTGLGIVNTHLRMQTDSDSNPSVINPRWSRFKKLNRFLTYFGNPGLMPGALFASSVLREITYPTGEHDLLFNADSLLWFRFLKKGGNITTINNCDYVYVRNELQSSSSPANDEMMALSRFIRISESETKLQKLLAQAGVEFDRNFVNFSSYLSFLLRLMPDLKIPKYARLLNLVYSFITRNSKG